MRPYAKAELGSGEPGAFFKRGECAREKQRMVMVSASVSITKFKCFENSFAQNINRYKPIVKTVVLLF